MNFYVNLKFCDKQRIQYIGMFQNPYAKYKQALQVICTNLQNCVHEKDLILKCFQNIHAYDTYPLMTIGIFIQMLLLQTSAYLQGVVSNVTEKS